MNIDYFLSNFFIIHSISCLLFIFNRAPFNAFILVNKVIEKEIHLPYLNVTNLGFQSLDFNGVNKDADGNFISDNGFPWG